MGWFRGKIWWAGGCVTGMVYFLCHATVPFESLVSIEFWCRSSSMLTRGKFASSWTSPLQRRNGPFLSHHLLSRVVGEEMLGAQIICPTFFGGVICHVSAQSLHFCGVTLPCCNLPTLLCPRPAGGCHYLPMNYCTWLSTTKYLIRTESLS